MLLCELGTKEFFAINVYSPESQNLLYELARELLGFLVLLIECLVNFRISRTVLISCILNGLRDCGSGVADRVSRA